MTEQEAFEAWATREGWHMSKPRYDKNRQYTSPKTQTLWEGWQARATPADQLQPTKNEPPPMPKVKPVRFVCAMCEDAPTWPNNPCMSCKRLDYQAIATPADHSNPLGERLIAAIEGECDGLAITEEQASNILAYLQYGAPMDGVLNDAQRYRKLRNADINSINSGGVFAGLTPDNVVINGEDLDIAVDLLIDAKEKS